MDLYFARHDGEPVTTDDFVRCMEDASGRDLGQFRRWYRPGRARPELEVSDDYDAEQRTYTLSVRQSCPPTPGQPDKEPLHIPFAVGLLDAQGADLLLRLAGEGAPGSATRVLELREPEEVFRFVDVLCRPTPSLLRGFSAPVEGALRLRRRVRFMFPHGARTADGFNRWDAASCSAQRVDPAPRGRSPPRRCRPASSVPSARR